MITVSMETLLDEEAKLEFAINAAIDQFIKNTQIVPKIKVTETETKYSCGYVKDVSVKISVEI